MKLTKIITSTALLASLMVTTMGTSVVSAVSPVGDKKAIEKAMKSDKRSEKFIMFDANRRPDQVLGFAGVKPGMTVLDINSGGGYYSEILAGVVGNKGMVYAHNGPVYWSFMKSKDPVAYTNFPNITAIHTGKEAVDLKENSVDAAISILAYHDYYFKHAAHSGEDIVAVNKSVYKALKPGGVYVIVDHIGFEGMDEEMMNKIHRIDPKRVIKEMEAAGFKLDAEHDALKNANDFPDRSWFGNKVRYSTSRFIYRFKKVN